MAEQPPDFTAARLLAVADIPFAERRDALIAAARVYLDERHDACCRLHRQGGDGRAVVACMTATIDELIGGLYRCVTAGDPAENDSCLAVIALGGYGRGEMNPRSDIDLMFYCGDREKAHAEQLAQRMLYLLWDLNLDVGYSVRTATDCLDLAQQDLTIRTSLLDTRFLAGDPEHFDDFRRQVYQPMLTRDSQTFLRLKYEEHCNRLGKYGSSVYLLEPNIKEGEGGLRDLHTAVWMARVKYKVDSLADLLAKGVISEQELAGFASAFDSLWRIRNELHFLSRRKNDQLLFEHQEKIAAFLGYRKNRKAKAVEQFMRDYYAQATRTEHLATSLIMRCYRPGGRPLPLLGYLGRRVLNGDFFIYQDELKTTRKSLFAERPAAMMEAFLLAKRHSARLDIDLKGQIRSHLHLVNDAFRRSRQISAMFLEILGTPGGIGQSLRDMHHLEFLGRYIPEFRRIYCQVQYDAYHIYTVDIHSIFAVEEVEKLWDGVYAAKKPLLTRVANDIEQRALLVLAVLFHDIGKGEGQDHANKGGDMIPTIARRLHLGRESSQRLEFLVRRHLDMAHISQRRDLHDDRLIQDFANTMMVTENLKMLYLLTFADLKAVGPDVWSEWKGMLLQELYEKSYDMLERGNFMRDLRTERVRNRKRKVIAALAEQFGDKAVKDLVRTLGPRYLLSHRSWEIVDHARLELQRGGETLAMSVDHDTDAEFTRVKISTVDVPGLFSMIAGVMAANGINILGAQIYTRKNGNALDMLHVNKPVGGAVDNPVKWQKVRDDLAAVLEGRRNVDDLIGKRQKATKAIGKKLPRFPSRIVFDNEASVEYTVIDLFAHDRIGLLYRVTRVLAELGLYIYVAKISTKVDQIADTFYVKDIFGQKIKDDLRLAEIQARLMQCLDD
ncbi:MAG: [protein-PII] uridylyltransferase [Desulfuromonadales bacterium]|nr:[protein-PII] uridylyltransferase [Desulfuromonadales bacterium]